MKLSLKAARVNANLTQNQAAEKLGVDVKTVSHWEKGDSYPDVPKIKAIESLYNIKYDDIIFLPS
jgi:putative transcriptional regulator